jgi:hypothetical protein
MQDLVHRLWRRRPVRFHAVLAVGGCGAEVRRGGQGERALEERETGREMARVECGFVQEARAACGLGICEGF